MATLRLLVCIVTLAGNKEILEHGKVDTKKTILMQLVALTDKNLEARFVNG